MDIATYIRERPQLDLRPSGGANWRGSCPFHRAAVKDPFSINVENGLWLCRSASCGLKGGFPLFYKLVEGVSWGEVKKALEGARTPFRNFDQFLRMFAPPERSAAAPPLPELPFFARPVTRDAFPAYLRDERGYDPSLADLGFDLRVCTAGAEAGRLILPYYKLDGQLATYSARAMDGREPRYLFPDGAPAGRYLYGVWRLGHAGPVRRLWVVEGPFDVLRLATLGEYAVALSGNQASSAQLFQLCELARLFQVPLYVCLDRGALGPATRVYGELWALGARPTYLVDIEPFAKDPGTLDAASLGALIETVRPPVSFA